MKLQEMLRKRAELLNYADSIQSAAKNANRATTSNEESIIASSVEQVDALDYEPALILTRTAAPYQAPQPLDPLVPIGKAAHTCSAVSDDAVVPDVPLASATQIDHGWGICTK